MGAGEGASASRSKGPRLLRPSWDLLRTICARRASCSRDFILRKSGRRGWVGRQGRMGGAPRAGRQGLTWLPSTARASQPPGPGVRLGTGPAPAQEARGSAHATVPDGAAQLWPSAPARYFPGSEGTQDRAWARGQDRRARWAGRRREGHTWDTLVPALSPVSPCGRARAGPGWLLLGLLAVGGLPIQGEPRVHHLPQHLRPLLLQLSGWGWGGAGG